MIQAIAQWLFDPSGLTPHGFCLLWEPGLIWTHAVSDTAIAAAYFSIPAALVVLVHRRRDLMFRPLFFLFAAFILLCGAEHLLEVLTLWVPAYGLQGSVKVITAVTSVVTAVALWRLLPQGLALPSPAQLRQANNALQQSEARYRSSFERSPVPVYTLDGDGLLTGVSESWLTLLGYEPIEVLGRPIADFLPSPSAPEQFERLRRDGEIHDMEGQFVRNDGTFVQALVSARLERPGETNGIVCVLIDISARRRAEEALRASEERLHQAQKMDAVGQLTGGIAHDFNNMLQGIAGGLDLMERRIRQGRADEAGQYVALARQSVDRAAGLTHRMLAFARRQALQPRAVEPGDLVRGMAELIARTVGPGIRLGLQLGGGDWHARCDANQLESALLNLAINARDAMPEGGSLTISTADHHVVAGSLADRLEIEPGDYVEIEVTDTGAGMPADVLARAFEPFFTTKLIGKGTGLGLSQLYGFVRQSGGGVRLESEPGRGTTVRLYLPRHAEPSYAGMEDRIPDHHPAKRSQGTVLLVEDEEKVRTVISAALTDLGCTVLEAENGPAGLAIMHARQRIDLLLTDVGLPGMNGRQLAAAAREWQPGVPVLLITGYAGSALEEMSLAPGMEVMCKPFTIDKLADQVSSILDGALVG